MFREFVAAEWSALMSGEDKNISKVKGSAKGGTIDYWASEKIKFINFFFEAQFFLGKQNTGLTTVIKRKKILIRIWKANRVGIR